MRSFIRYIQKKISNTVRYIDDYFKKKPEEHKRSRVHCLAEITCITSIGGMEADRDWSHWRKCRKMHGRSCLEDLISDKRVPYSVRVRALAIYLSSSEALIPPDLDWVDAQYNCYVHYWVDFRWGVLGRRLLNEAATILSINIAFTQSAIAMNYDYRQERLSQYYLVAIRFLELLHPDDEVARALFDLIPIDEDLWAWDQVRITPWFKLIIQSNTMPIKWKFLVDGRMKKAITAMLSVSKWWLSTNYAPVVVEYSEIIFASQHTYENTLFSGQIDFILSVIRDYRLRIDVFPGRRFQSIMERLSREDNRELRRRMARYMLLGNESPFVVLDEGDLYFAIDLQKEFSDDRFITIRLSYIIEQGGRRLDTCIDSNTAQ